jgi:hypothetical protein
MTKPLVIYHDNCADGFTAMWCFWRYFKDDAEYLGGHYQQAVPDVLDRDVYLVDFSYKHDIVEAMLLAAKSVTLIDHHASALDDLWPLQAKGLNMDFCSLDKSGAMLAWEFIQTRQKIFSHADSSEWVSWEDFLHLCQEEALPTYRHLQRQSNVACSQSKFRKPTWRVKRQL